MLQALLLGCREELSDLGLNILLVEDFQHVDYSVLLLVLSSIVCDAAESPDALQALLDGI